MTFPEERKRHIIDKLKTTQRVKVSDVSERFGVSMETVRRDLALLEDEGLVKRVYGGAVSGEAYHEEAPLLSRQLVMKDEKRRIGKAAASLVQDNSTIVLDIGTTVLELAKALKSKSNITVLTNSLLAANILLDHLQNKHFSGQVILLGGQMNEQQYSMTGKLTEMTLEHFTIDQAFISVGGLSPENGLSDYDVGESMISKQMIGVSKEVIVLADSSKLGIDSFCKFASLTAADIVISNDPLPSPWKGNDKVKNIHWITTS